MPTDHAEKFGFLLTCLLRKGTAGYENPAERAGSVQQTNANHKETLHEKSSSHLGKDMFLTQRRKGAKETL